MESQWGGGGDDPSGPSGSSANAASEPSSAANQDPAASEVKDYLTENTLDDVMTVLLDIHDDNSTTEYPEQVVHDTLLAWIKARKGLQATRLARKYPGF